MSAALLMAISVSAANAAILYNDGAPNGTYNAWGDGGTQQIEDFFNLAGPSVLRGVTFGNWLTSTETGTTVEWAIVGSEGSQIPVCNTCSGTATLTAGASFAVTFVVGNITFIGVDQIFSLPDISLGAGTYWLALGDETYNQTGNTYGIYWDMNGGPSNVWQNSLGDQSGSNCFDGAGLCSNSFTILGSASSLTPVPEPLTLSIFGAGLVAAAAIRRRKKSKQV